MNKNNQTPLPNKSHIVSTCFTPVNFTNSLQVIYFFPQQALQSGRENSLQVLKAKESIAGLTELELGGEIGKY